MAMIEVVERYIYPVKSMAGYLLPDNEPMVIDTEGVEGSRRWMLIDDNGEPVTARQRGMETMLAIHPVPAGGDSFILDNDVFIEPLNNYGEVFEFNLFKDTVMGRKDSKGSAWIQKRLGRDDLNLVHFVRDGGRNVHEDKLWKGSEPRAFVDGYQVSLFSQDTVDDLRTRWPSYDGDSRRPRADIVVHGTRPKEEFIWAAMQLRMSLDNVVLAADAPIDRCPMPGIHPDTLERSKEFAQMTAAELKMDTPDPKAGPLACFSIGLHVIRTGIIPAHAELNLIG